MKRMLTILVAVLLLGLSNYGLAQETEETPTTVTVGLKMWYATWEETFEEETMESDYGLMYGPVINIRHGKIFVGLSYLTGGGFTFEDSWTEYWGYPYYTYVDFETEIEADRTDMDLSVGYSVNPNVGVFLGYKTLTLDYTASARATTKDLTVEIEEYGDFEFSGPAFGVTAHTRIGESRAMLFGTLSYVSLEGENDEELSGPAIEFGLAYALETMPVSVTLGYKYQKYEGEDEEDVFSGLTVGVNYTF